MGKSNKGFLFFYDWIDVLEELEGKDFKRLVMAMINYQRDGTPPPEFKGVSRVIAQLIFPQIDRRIANAEAGKTGMKNRYSDNGVNNGVSNGVSNNADNGVVDAVSNQDKTRQDKTKTIDKTRQDEEGALVTLPFSDGEFAVSSVLAEKYKNDYTNIDVMAELEKIKSWLRKNNKPLSEANQFICGWLKGENERAVSTVKSNPVESSFEADDFFRAALEKSKTKGFGV